MAQGLELMNKLFAPESSQSTTSNTPDDAGTGVSGSTADTAALAAINAGKALAAYNRAGKGLASDDTRSSTESVIAENKQSIEVASNLLQCSCADTGFLLTMLAIIVFKILERYTLAARGNGSRQRSDLTASEFDTSRISPYLKNDTIQQHGGCLNDVSQRRMTAQLILSELHRVQGLVNQLAIRLISRRGAIEQRPETNCEPSFPFMTCFNDGMSTAAFSASTLGQMEVDLRKCVASLSSEIINILRQS
jgi:hypothetical protein